MEEFGGLGGRATTGSTAPGTYGAGARLCGMCRSIKTLRDYDQPASEEEIEAASLQYVRKISGFRKPSKVNQEAFDRAVDQVTAASKELLLALTPTAKAGR